MKSLFKVLLRGIPSIFLLMLVSAGWSEDLTDRQKLDRINEMYKDYKKSFPDTPDVSVEELIVMKENSNIVIVDRRKKKEQDVSMLPGAITAKEFEKNIERYRDKTIVVYCTIGSRSGHYAKRLQKKGISAFNLKGSILSWIHAGQRIVDKDGETRRVHVYGPEWNLVPDGYEAVW